MHVRKIVAALTAVAMLASTLVLADNNVIDQGSYYKNAQNGAKVDANGNAYTTDASRDRDNWRLVPLLNTNLTASGVNMVDSTVTPVATYDFSRMNLLLKGNFDSLSTVVRVAVQIRGHWGTLSDSSAVYPWYRWPQRQTPAIPVTVAGVLGITSSAVLHSAAAAGSLGLFTPVPLGYMAVGSGIPPGTYVVSKGTSDSAATLSANLSQPLNGSVTFYPPTQGYGYSAGYSELDSLGHMFVGSYAQAQVTTANQPFASGGVWPGEFIVKFNVATQDSTAAGNGKYGAGPNTMLIPLCDASGAWFNSPYTSVRIRVLNGVRNRFKIRADIMGVSK
jgi:hypothetical protein